MYLKLVTSNQVRIQYQRGKMLNPTKKKKASQIGQET